MKGIMFKIAILSAVAAMLFISGCGENTPKDKRAALQINSTPDEAKVFIMGKEIGVTPFKAMVPPGTYLVKLEKLNYKPSWVKVVCSTSDKKAVEVQLQPVTAYVMIRSNPAATKVEINGQVVGETPIVLPNQTVGQHSAMLKKQGFVPREITWMIEDGRPQLINAELSSNIGTLVINSNPAGARVIVDERPMGQTPFKSTFEQGGHKIKVELSGYFPQEESIIIEKNKTVSKSMNLQIMPGTLTVESRPAGANLTVNDKQYGQTPATLKDLPPGTYKVKIEMDGCDPAEQSVVVAPGQDTKVTLALDRNAGGIDLVVNPPGVTIYLDGKKVGVSLPDEKDPTISKVFQIRDISIGKHVITVAHKRAEPSQKKTFEVTIKKSQIARPENVELWIPDYELELINGKKMKGKLIEKRETSVFFEPEPRVKTEYQYREVKSLNPLKFEE